MDAETEETGPASPKVLASMSMRQSDHEAWGVWRCTCMHQLQSLSCSMACRAGIKFLVDLRSDAIAASKAAPSGDAALRLLTDSLRQGCNQSLCAHVTVRLQRTGTFLPIQHVSCSSSRRQTPMVTASDRSGHSFACPLCTCTASCLISDPAWKVILSTDEWQWCRQSLADWFSVGLLHLHCIEWHTASAALLETVMKYEAVHAFQVCPPLLPPPPLPLTSLPGLNAPSCLAQLGGLLLDGCVCLLKKSLLPSMYPRCNSDKLHLGVISSMTLQMPSCCIGHTEHE